MDAHALDVDQIRTQFPALARTHDGAPFAYFDGPGGSQVPLAVADAMTQSLLHANANCGGAFATSIEADAAIAEARRAAADFTGSRPEEIAFGANTTTLQFLLAHAAARTFDPGDEIITTELDHDSNVAQWLRVADDHGLVVRQARLHRTDGTLDLHHLEGLLSPRTRVVAFTLASNHLGTVPPVAKITALARSVGALTWADGVHFAPHRRLDREAMGIDVLFTSPYKWFGPHLGVASIRLDLAEAWPAERGRPADETPAGHRFETGTQSHEAMAGMTAAVDYLASLGGGSSRRERLDAAYAAIRAHEDALALRFLAGVREMEHLALYGLVDPARLDERVATFSFTVDGAPPVEVAQRLAQRGIAVWDGNFYALSASEALGLEERGGAVRAGFLHYTTTAEVDRLVDALGELG
ncbi:MAG: cysteine desulfurase-like protein [Gaiellales bacterium]